jgi:hypothetical protein
MLLPDATVLVGGGDLSNNETESTDHYDGHIYQPAYLFTPDGKTAPLSGPKTKTDKQPIIQG